MLMLGWGGGTRTPECQDQNLVPYHLATPHHRVYFNVLRSFRPPEFYRGGSRGYNKPQV
jgi:hypothetical protein